MDLDWDMAAEYAELAAIAAEAIGWQPLCEGHYLHLGNPDEPVIHVAGVADAGMAGMNVLLML